METMVLLMEEGANITIKNRMKETAIDVARNYGNNDLVELLEHYGIFN